MALDLPSIRADFPILSRVLPSGRQLVYLDNAATTQKPKAVIQAMTHYYENINSNVHRSLVRLLHLMRKRVKTLLTGSMLTVTK